MVQRLRALTALLKVLSSTPSMHTAAHNCLMLSLNVHIYVHAGKVPIYTKYTNKSFKKRGREIKFSGKNKKIKEKLEG